MSPLIGPANFKFFGFFPAAILSVLIPVIGVALFTYIMARRIAPIVRVGNKEKICSATTKVKLPICA